MWSPVRSTVSQQAISRLNQAAEPRRGYCKPAEDQFTEQIYGLPRGHARRPNVLALGTYGLVKHRCSGTARDP